MSPHLLSLSLPDDQLAAIDASLSQLEAQLSGLVSLQIEECRARKLRAHRLRLHVANLEAL